MYVGVYPLIVFSMLFAIVHVRHAMKANRLRSPCRVRVRNLVPLRGITQEADEGRDYGKTKKNGDVLLQALSADKDIAVKVVR